MPITLTGDAMWAASGHGNVRFTSRCLDYLRITWRLLFQKAAMATSGISPRADGNTDGKVMVPTHVHPEF